MNDNSDKMTGKWRTISEACDILGVSKRTIQRRFKKGDIESKLENGRRFVLVTSEQHSDAFMAQDGLVEQLRQENERLRQQLDKKDEQIGELQKSLQQAQVNLDHNQQLLAYAQLPWYRKLGRKALPQGDVVDMEPDIEER